ncbi:MAG TPA: arsenosugar biosynthesis radical SAM (seleno)protein ArsS [Gemmataceae bacterium]|nr:arsenosugar biosynthesis radical SAM (seleno)protein ArsS [Gemmataceae bacterium]
MVTLSLLHQGNPLSNAENQVAVLKRFKRKHSFEMALAQLGELPLRATGIQVLQVNLGKLCNQTCCHCHVDAGPDRREIMSKETMQACLDVLSTTDIPTLDITGGAPEMAPDFRWLVRKARCLGRHVIDRSNLTILLAPGFQDLPEFLAEHQVEIVASLPCYLEENTDAQRGGGVFNKSITALRRLNELGYGHPESGLTLTLVHNPLGPFLPPDQAALEAAYRRELKSRYNIVFNRLYTITNMPISRFLDDLIQHGKYENYMQTLSAAFNPAAVGGLMCRWTLSVSWEGYLFDCDFNQMLELGVAEGLPQHIRDFDWASFRQRRIVIGQHCFGCTAGAGSGCQGAIAP